MFYSLKDLHDFISKNHQTKIKKTRSKSIDFDEIQRNTGIQFHDEYEDSVEETLWEETLEI